MKKRYFLLIMLSIICINVDALELCTPSEEYLEYEKLSEEEKNEYIKPTYCKEILDNQENKSIFKKKLYPKVYKAVTDPNYNSYTDKYTTTPKNQYQTGLCWDFSAISAVEANAKLKGLGTFDLSEAHLAYSILGDVYSDAAGKKGKYNVSVGDGGYITYAPTYFFGGYGQLSESDLEFNSVLTNQTKNFKKISSSQYIKGQNLVSIDNFYEDNYHNSGICSDSDISTIKANIIKYGSSQAMMYMDQDLFKDTSEDYYISTSSNSSYSNHAVTIVGWNDTISKKKFSNATRDGAWIIKNSWGPTWSGDGFFYISYDDQFICSKTANYETSEKKDYNHTYKSSELVGYQKIRLTNTFYIATKLKKESEEDIVELLDKISFSVGENMSYKVYLSKDNNINNKTNWIELDSGNSSLYGIISAYLNNIKINDDFTIIIEGTITSGEYSSVYTTCNDDEDHNNITFNQDENYISFNGINNWIDMSNIQTTSGTIKCQPTIYAYTNDILPSIEYTNISNSIDKTIISFNTTSIDTTKLSYKIYDLKYNDITSNFTVTPNYETNKITITSSTDKSATYVLSINYDNGIRKIIKETPFQYTASKIELNEKEMTIEKGESTNLIATITPSSYPNKNVEWQSSNESILKVENGKVTGVAVGTATITAKIDNGKTASCNITVTKAIPKVLYSTHVQNLGWQNYVKDGTTSGTSGRGFRLEGIKIKIENKEYAGNIEYRTHIQNLGWEKEFKKNNELSGTSGRSLRLEAIEIRLTGEVAEHYDIYYRVHAENFGWLGWARNGESAGTAGYSFRLEAIQIKLVEKNIASAGYGQKVAFKKKNILYSTHVQNIGWQNYAYDGTMSGTSGRSLRLEGIKIKLNDIGYSGNVEYRTHIQNIGWEKSFKKNDATSGTSGRSLRLEAIQIKLTGEVAEHYDIYYQVHAENFGWLGWARNGESSGTAGYAFRLEGIKIKLVPKAETFAEYGKKQAFKQKS